MGIYPTGAEETTPVRRRHSPSMTWPRGVPQPMIRTRGYKHIHKRGPDRRVIRLGAEPGEFVNRAADSKISYAISCSPGTGRSETHSGAGRMVRLPGRDRGVNRRFGCTPEFVA